MNTLITGMKALGNYPRCIYSPDTGLCELHGERYRTERLCARFYHPEVELYEALLGFVEERLGVPYGDV